MKILIVIGTRPEVIKIAILYKLLYESNLFEPHLAITGQHKDLIHDNLLTFGLKPDSVFTILDGHNDLVSKMNVINDHLNALINEIHPDMIMVQGDTLSAYCGAITATLNNIPICHIEAGLRSGSKKRPYPEEIFRQLIDKMADMHFAPSKKALQTLIDERIESQLLANVGNTGIDALEYLLNSQEDLVNDDIKQFVDIQKQNDRCLLLLTMHRRENLGDFRRQVNEEIKPIIEKRKYGLIHVVHPNTSRIDIINEYSYLENVLVVGPQNYSHFIGLLDKIDIVLTDSGGLQEEAAYLAKPMIILRSETEREEVLDERSIKLYSPGFLEKDLNEICETMTTQCLAYGDGKASQRIVKLLKEKFIHPPELHP